MDERARIALRTYSDCPAPATQEEREIQAAKDWAVSELYFLLCDHPFDDPETLIAEFAVMEYPKED